MTAPRHIDAALVRRLVAEQFPAWAHLAVRPVDVDGWDNRSFRLGDELTVRLPSAEGYVPQVGKEVRWLPYLAARVNVPIPVVLGVGRAGSGYPFPWTVRRWIEGETASAGGADRRALAAEVAGFLRALRTVDPQGPAPGLHSAGRGAPLAQWDGEVRRAAGAPGVDTAKALTLWDGALAASADRAVWFHGDIAPGNLLTTDGRLSAVIDFGQAGVGDPSCDLAIAWAWFDRPARERFREVLAPDAGEWARGRGWALWKALITLDDPHRADDARRTLAELVVLG